MKQIRGLTIIKSIACGSFGTVYYAKNLSDDSHVALKAVRKILRPMRIPVPQPENEALIQGELSHNNVVNLLEYWDDSENFYMTFEWMDQSLSTVLMETVEMPVKLSYMRMLLSAVSYIHKCSIIHRDIKPQNLLINSDNVLKLGDFGLARRMPCSDLSSTAGTREYRAPEMLYGSRNYDEKVDIWACGCVCGEIWNGGKILFQSDSDIGQLGLVISVMGDIQCRWEGVKNLPDFGKISFRSSLPVPGIWNMLKEPSENFVQFLELFFVYNPDDRISAAHALENIMFCSNNKD